MRFVILAALAFAQPLSAQVRPLPGTGDPRLQTIPYRADQVVSLTVASGYQLMVAFDEGERIDTVAVGDSSAWQVTANKRGDALFVKNLQANVSTNLTVVTDARVYSFELSAAYGAADMPYLVRFIYPEPPKVVAPIAVDTGTYRYRLSGARALRPSAIEDDGERTVIVWPSKATLPAVFRIEDDGLETLVNGEMRDGRFVIAGVAGKLVFRLDREVATAVRTRVRERRR